MPETLHLLLLLQPHASVGPQPLLLKLETCHAAGLAPRVTATLCRCWSATLCHWWPSKLVLLSLLQNCAAPAPAPMCCCWSYNPAYLVLQPCAVPGSATLFCWCCSHPVLLLVANPCCCWPCRHLLLILQPCADKPAGPVLLLVLQLCANAAVCPWSCKAVPPLDLKAVLLLIT